MDDGEAAFAGHPLARSGENARIVQDGGLVEEDASAVNGSRKRHLFGMEVVES